jgi:branched-chain amino acid transport system permease protein
MRSAKRLTLGFGPVGVAMVAAFAAVILILPGLLSNYYLFLCTSALIFALLVQGVGMVTGRAGMIVLSQLGFAAVGAYVFLLMRIHVSSIGFVGAVIVSGLAAAAVGVLVGLPALRLRGVNLGILTLVFGVTVNVILSSKGFPGQNEAYFAERPEWLLDESSYLYFCGAIFAISSVAFAFLDRTRLGASWLAVRRSERATAALGRNVALTKMSAFALGATVGGIAGALFVGQQGTVTVESFLPIESLIIFALAIMLGARYAEGALLAGVMTIFLPVLFEDLGISQNIPNLLFAFGAVLGLLGGRGAAEDIRYRLGKQFGRSLPALAVAPEGEASKLKVKSAAAAPAGSNSGPVDNALEVRGLTMHYGQVCALDHVDVSVPVGSVTAVIGPNGAGKSTLIDCVSGFVRTYEGEVLIRGEAVDSMAAHTRAAHGLRRSFQQDRTIESLTVGEYLRLAMPRAVSKKTSDDDVSAILAAFDGPDPRRLLATVDVGSRRLVEVVGAIAARPDVVLLDEPAAGLGAEESARLAQHIASIPDLIGPAVLLVEHDMELVQAACAHMTVLDFGKVIASGDPKEVLADPTVAKAYLGQEILV